MKTPRRKIIIPAGTTWTETVTWCSVPMVYKDVTAVTRGLPTTLTVPSHGIPADVVVPVYLANTGLLKLNTASDKPFYASRVDADNLVLHGVDTLTKPAAGTTPRIAYMTVRNLAGHSAVVQFRSGITGSVLVELNSTTGGILLTGSKLSFEMSPTQSRALLQGGTVETSGSAQVEVTTPDNDVLRLWQYDWTATPEWTR